MAKPFANTGEQLPRIGYGAMGITSFYASDGENAVIEASGVDAMVAYANAVAPAKAFIDTAFIYAASRPGGRHNEEVVGDFIKRVGRDRVFLATKGSLNANFTSDSSDAGLRAQLATSLSRLGVSSVDLYYEHRRDVATPIESVMATFKVSEWAAALSLSVAPSTSATTPPGRWHVLHAYRNLCAFVAAIHSHPPLTPPLHRRLWRRARSASWASPSAPLASCAARTQSSL